MSLDVPRAKVSANVGGAPPSPWKQSSSLQHNSRSTTPTRNGCSASSLQMRADPNDMKSVVVAPRGLCLWKKPPSVTRSFQRFMSLNSSPEILSFSGDGGKSSMRTGSTAARLQTKETPIVTVAAGDPRVMGTAAPKVLRSPIVASPVEKPPNSKWTAIHCYALPAPNHLLQ